MNNINKVLSLLALLIPSLFSGAVGAQDVNWRALNGRTNHLVTTIVGADYSSYCGLSYGYVLETGRTPVVIGAEYTVPFGEPVADDWKLRASAQGQLWRNRSFSLAVKPGFILRRNESILSRMYNVGADVTLSFGYVKAKWGLIGLANYDMPLSTHINHRLLKDYYPAIKDGWYGISGGNVKWGARANIAIRSWHVFLTAGKAYGQNFADNPTLPFFAEFSIQRPFRK